MLRALPSSAAWPRPGKGVPDPGAEPQCRYEGAFEHRVVGKLPCISLWQGPEAQEVGLRNVEIGCWPCTGDGSRRGGPDC